MSPAEWTTLANVVGAVLTSVLVAITTAILTRAQTEKVKAETTKILKEVRPNGGGSSHDAIMRELGAVKSLQQTHHSLLTAHVTESTADRAAIHLVIDAKPWVKSPNSPQPWAE